LEGNNMNVAQLRFAGMSAELHGVPDDRPPLVLLHGLTFDRDIWRTTLHELAAVDPGRHVLLLDLPGHGTSPDQLPHSLDHVVALVHGAVEEAGLSAPVLVGHSIAGGLASIYAARHATRGVVSVDAAPEVASIARLLASMAEQIRGPEFPAVWSMMEQSWRTDLLPRGTRELIARNSHPRQDVVISYWHDLLSQDPERLQESVRDAMRRVAAAQVPYVLVAGAELPPGMAEHIGAVMPQFSVEVWADTGHFPHLAHPRRFAALLAATGRWRVGREEHAAADQHPFRQSAGLARQVNGETGNAW
jgi:pimeloyl-ACP methyl ester carboxylesterase